VAGQLLGLEMDGILEITYAFPFPESDEETKTGDQLDTGEYQLDMLRFLRDVNVDSNNVGWYLSSFNGNHIGRDLFDSQFSYQSDIRNSVVITYDPMVSEEGSLSLRAYRLNESVMNLLKDKTFSKKTLLDNNFNYEEFLEELQLESLTVVYVILCYGL
jgi:translation initiation factor 3 subunit H